LFIDNKNTTFYYVLSAKAAAEAAKTEPVQADIAFETGNGDEGQDDAPF